MKAQSFTPPVMPCSSTAGQVEAPAPPPGIEPGPTSSEMSHSATARSAPQEATKWPGEGQGGEHERGGRRGGRGVARMFGKAVQDALKTADEVVTT